MYLGVFRPTEYVFGYYYSMLRHVDAQENILTDIIVCSLVLTVPGVLRPTECVFGDYYGMPQQVDAQEKILTEIIVCSSVLTVPRGFSTGSERSWELFRCAPKR